MTGVAPPLEVREPDHPYVSRGGVKLAGALDAFAYDPAGKTIADFGASTGGFTDCLLQRGAARSSRPAASHSAITVSTRL